MNSYIRKATGRGAVDLGWLKSRHSFSFGQYYDPKHMGLSVLRVINDDVVEPGQGFGTHGHKDMEIISYVIRGALEHKDSEGNEHIIPAGDIQRMSAGTGIHHSEYNASQSESVRFLQIWILPEKNGLPPGYEQKTVSASGHLTELVSPSGSEQALRINQDMTLSLLKLDAGETVNLPIADRTGYLHIISGKVTTAHEALAEGDAMGVSETDAVTVTAERPVEALWFNLPPA